MSEARAALDARRAQIIDRIEAQRQELSERFTALEAPLGLADNVVNVVKWWKGGTRNPAAGLLAWVPLPGPLKALRWVVRGVEIWRAVRSAIRA